MALPNLEKSIMPRQDSAAGLVVRIGGDSAKGGVDTTGQVFARIAALAGLEVYTTRTIPAEIKGGHVMFQVRAAAQPIHAQGDALDVLLAYDQESYDKYHRLLKPTGILIYDSDEFTPPDSGGTRYGLPFDQLAKSINFTRGRNIVAIGCLVKLFDLPYAAAQKGVERQLGRKKELFEQNLLALQTGYEYVEQNIARESPYHFKAMAHVEGEEERLVLSGNQALAIGAIAAGCRFYAGYPITPASDIMEFLAGEFPKIGGMMVQAEDEMAALAMVLGASFTGVRAMTATSGPGLALMIELLGHASMTETPCVIVDVQRAGPSTGMPTKVSQGDLRLAMFGGNDEAPRFVVAPVTVEDCFYQMIHAFNLAEKYQMPTVFLSDQDMSVRVQTIPLFDLSRVRIEPRALYKPNGQNYERYAVTANGVSPMSLPGMRGGQYTAEGLEHMASGAPGYDPELHQTMMEKRWRKLEAALPDIEAWGMFEEWGDADAPVAIVGWGSTIGPVREAMERARGEGMKVAALYPKVLSPLPTERIGKFIAKRQAVIVPELNMQGQLAEVLQARFERPFVRLNKYVGVPFTTEEVYQKIQSVYASQRVSL